MCMILNKKNADVSTQQCSLSHFSLMVQNGFRGTKIEHWEINGLTNVVLFY